MKLVEILKRKTLPFVLASALTFNSLLGCKIDPIPIPTPDPIINQLPETTKPLDNSTTDKLISYEDGTLTFDESTGQLKSILVGDIIVGGVSAVTPNGILGKVISISSDNKTIYTTQTNLEEAIKNCSVEFNHKLTPSQIESSILARGVIDKSLGEGFDFSTNLENVILYDSDDNFSTTNDQVIANGNISFNSDFDMYLEIQNFKLTELKFGNKINETVKLELTGESSMPYLNRIVKIAEYNFTPFVAAWIPTTPPFPIVLAPKLEVNVNFEGELSSNIITNVTQNAELISRLIYENGNWNSISDFSNNFQFNEPQLTTNAFAKIGLGPRLNLLLYGVAGPYAEINGYAKIKADINKYPWWNLYGGLEAKLGVNVQVLGHTIANYNKTVIDFEKLLTRANLGKIVFESNREDGRPDIWVMDADGSNTINLTNNSSWTFDPTWSPDGKKIAFSFYEQIYIMNSDGSNQTRLTSTGFVKNSSDWSPDGTKIVFVQKKELENEEIYVMNADGSNEIRLTNNSSYLPSVREWWPDWSPDGKKIAFVSNRDGNSEIYIMDSNGSNQTRITNNSYSDSTPAWSPSGKKIAFVSNRDGNSEIYIMDSNGSNQTRITNNFSFDRTPAYSPDGTKIAFVSNRDGNSEIYIMDSNGSNQTRITNNPTTDMHPEWCPVE